MQFLEKFSSLMVLSCLLACGLLWSGPAWAHKLSAFAYLEGGSVHVESKFGSGKPCQNCETKLIAPLPGQSTGQELAKASTDLEGRCVFALQDKPAGELRIVVTGGSGHQGEWTMSAAEFSQFQPDPAPLAAAPASAALEKKFEPAPSVPASSAAAPAPAQTAAAAQAAPCPPAVIDEALLRKLVAEEMEKKIGPLRALLLESKLGGASFKDVLGGVGYILGLAGLAALLTSRKK